MKRSASGRVTLSETLVLGICLSAVGWLFVTVVQTYGGYAQLPDMQSRLAALEQRCDHAR